MVPGQLLGARLYLPPANRNSLVTFTGDLPAAEAAPAK